jgi:hypothetical protein
MRKNCLPYYYVHMSIMRNDYCLHMLSDIHNYVLLNIAPLLNERNSVIESMYYVFAMLGHLFIHLK